MQILVTGANGFVGKNLVTQLKNAGYTDITTFTKENTLEELAKLTATCDFVYHLAGVNRPKDTQEFFEGNGTLTEQLIACLEANQNIVPVMLSSSTQATLGNDYGKSKCQGEQVVREYGNKHQVPVMIYRFPNVFGKWSQPNYNSAIATFCHQVARDLPIQVNDPAVVMQLVYIDDVVAELIRCLTGDELRQGEFCYVPTVHTQKLGWIAETIQSFKKTRETRETPFMGDALTKKLYSTYLSFLPENAFSYELKMNVDQRGSFTEFLKTVDYGQVSINISKPGIVKGNHWHHTKNEKFLVVYGKGVVRFREIETDDVIEYHVSDEKLEVVDIPVGYTHHIENLGDTDMVTVMWANEPFDPENPDTYYLEV